MSNEITFEGILVWSEKPIIHMSQEINLNTHALGFHESLRIGFDTSSSRFDADMVDPFELLGTNFFDAAVDNGIKQSQVSSQVNPMSSIIPCFAQINAVKNIIIVPGWYVCVFCPNDIRLIYPPSFSTELPFPLLLEVQPFRASAQLLEFLFITIPIRLENFENLLQH
jgi:hypothetical protein